MDNDRKILRISAAVILGAVILRLLGSSTLGAALQTADKSDLASALLFLRTGRVVRHVQARDQMQAEETEVPETEPVSETPTPVVFTSEDVKRVSLNSYSGEDVDVQAMLAMPLDWDLTQEEPAVLILHTHGSESYTKTETYTESSEYRTLDEAYNMVSIGDAVASYLEAAGIGVIHDRQLHDYPSYNGAYNQARESLQEYLEEYPSIRLVLDLHRDAMVDSLGNQVGYTVSTQNGDAAKVMLVLGSGNENWEENTALAVKLHAQLEKLCPGICRPISLRGYRFNQDLSSGAVLIEVGAAGNTRQEALMSAQYISQAILDLAAGAVYQE